MSKDTRIFHAPVGADDRKRDVLPLPRLRESMLQKTGLSRSTARRVHERLAVTRRANLAIQSLNSMFFGARRVGGSEWVDSLSHLPLVQQDCMKHIIRRVKQLGPPPSDARCQGAFAALRTAGSSYMDFSPGVGDVVGMKLNELSLPSGSVAGVSL